MSITALESAYDGCVRLARHHYENFPVASFLLPAPLRRPVSAIYAFARTADDIADEGTLPDEERITQLNHYDSLLDAIASGGTPRDPLFIALADTIRAYSLPLEPFHDLLTAFRMDVTTKRYVDFQDVLGYCRYSANPIGRLLLHLFAAATPEQIRQSDDICTALQLINFLQDVRQDFEESGRIYIPLNDMAAHGISETDIRNHRSDEAMSRLIEQQIDRANSLLQCGAALGLSLKGRTGLELRAIILGGAATLRALRAQPDKPWSRPRLRSGDRLRMLVHACNTRHFMNRV